MDAQPLGPWGLSINKNDLATAAVAEKLGFSTLWLAGGQLDRLSRLTEVLAATDRAVVASSIIPADVYRPAQVLELYRDAEARYPGRLLVGLGGPQRPPSLRALEAYLDHLDELPPQRRVLAALGPRKLDLARERCGGAVPILITPDYTASVRRRLGASRTLAVGLYAVLDDNPTTARETARQPLRFLLGKVRGYRDSARRQGFSDHDIATLSDRLVDELTGWGSVETVAQRAVDLRAAGADHVYLSVLHDHNQPGTLAAARRLAPLLLSASA